MDLRKIDAEDIFAFAQIGSFQNLIAQQTAIRLHIDHHQAVIRILEKEPSHCHARAKNASAADGGGKNDFGHENQHASVAMLR
ncbi:MAG TPA: hypothetical protein VN516_04340, partial [Candidatus Baltobacteraceae bacterium]|nr:hypothetical protein [Candidatus Baltobacteraceae bacterium]